MKEKFNTVMEVRKATLAFRVALGKDGLSHAEMLLIDGDRVVDIRQGTDTTLGHAIAAADDLLDGWAFAEYETNAAAYFKEVIL